VEKVIHRPDAIPLTHSQRQRLSETKNKRLCDALVSRNSATTKYPYRMELFAWSYIEPFWYNTRVWQTHTHTHTHRRTDRYTTTAYTALSIALRGNDHEK